MPPLGQTRRCRTEVCQARIVWVTLIKTDGRPAPKKHPVNADPDPKGNLEYSRGGFDNPVVRALTQEQQADPAQAERYTSHFSSCPAAEGWRQQQAAKKRQRRRGAARRPAGQADR